MLGCPSDREAGFVSGMVQKCQFTVLNSSVLCDPKAWYSAKYLVGIQYIFVGCRC